MNKTGRNIDCPCGSGKKYKKCCLYKSVTSPSKLKNVDLSKGTLVKTLTDELFQPVRLYYTIYNKPKLIAHFKNLKCIDYDADLDEGILMYIEEATDFNLNVAPNKIPKKAQPLIIAKLFIEDKNTLLIDLRSIERAAEIILFMDKHISQTVIKITHAAIYNKLISTSHRKFKDITNIDYDDLFNEKRITFNDPEKKISETKAIFASHKNKEEAIKALSQKTEDDAKKPLPEVEKFPIYYYEEGITHFKTACQFRQIIATQHFLGEKNFSFHDLIQELLYKNQDQFFTEDR